MDNQQQELRTHFFNFTTRRPVAILMVVIGVVVFGWISYQQLPLNLMPDMTYPSLTVRTEYPGTAPQEIETTISRPIEQALGVIDNLVSISSVSKAEQSDVILEFTWDTDMNKATADIREKLDQVFLPEDANRPIILRYDPSLDPIMRLGLYGDRSLTYLRYLAEEEIKRALETVDGVAAVKVKGGLEEEIRVELDEQKLTLIGINIQAIKSRLSEENVNLAGGNLKEGQTEYLVRTLNEFKSVDQISEVVIGRWNNVNVKVKDVGRVYRSSKEREIITRIGGNESVEIEVYKEADANLVAVAEAVNNRLYGTPEQQAYVKRMESSEREGRKKEAQKAEEGRQEGLLKKRMTNFLTYDLPQNVNIQTLSDQSIFIENSINEVKTTAIQGGLLAILVLFVFLRRLSPTVIIGLAIPISIVATFAPMKMFSVSLNIMSLGGLALGIGMLVDNSIVVLESIARCREEGDGLIHATVRGVGEVGGAVIASTLTTIAVFFPIVFVQGVAGQVFGDLALTVVFALLASLAVALFLIPMLSSRKTEDFIREANIDRLPKEYILNYKIKDRIDYLFSDAHPKGFFVKLRELVTLIVQSLLIWATKTIRITFSLVLVVLKQFVINILLLPQPFIGLINLFKSNVFRYGDFVVGTAKSTHPPHLSFTNSVWPDYLTVESIAKLYDNFGALKGRFLDLNRWQRIFYAPWYGVKCVFYLIRHLLAAFFELVFSFFHAIVMAGGVFFYMLYLEVRLLATVPANGLVKAFDIVYGWVAGVYPGILKNALHNRYAVVAGLLVVFVFSVFVLGPQLGRELIPEVHQREFNLELTLPVGTPVETTDERIMPIQEEIQKLDGVKQVAAVAGTDKTATTESDEGEHTAKLTVTLEPTRNPAAAEERIIARVREIMDAFPGIASNITRPTIFSFKTPVEVYIKGYNLSDLQRFSKLLEDRMQEIPGLVDAKSNIQRGNPEIQIFYDREQIAHHGLNVRNVASIVRNKVRGDVATEFKEEDRRIDVLVRLREEDKESVSDLKRLVVNPSANVPVALNSVADIRINEGPSEIRRVDQQRTALITANLAPGASLNEVNQRIYETIENLNLPPDFSYELGGQNEEMQTSLNSLSMALALAIFLVYIVMASQFESLIHPFVIIFTIPMALIGVILFLYILDIPLSIVVFLGMIMLAGIVVNNAIVLVDYINHLRRSGMDKITAIIEAGKIRLRPILMTTATTVLGLLPMAIGMGDGAEIRTPMAITVIIGLITATVLTLIIIPTVYSIFSREKQLGDEIQ